MRTTSRLLKATSASSKAWLARQSRDPYVKLRTTSGPKDGQSDGTTSTSSYRSRSAFKLLQLDDKHHLFRFDRISSNVVVDLGASPGGWSQVVAEKMLSTRRNGGDGLTQTSSRSTLIAVDLLPMQPISGVSFIRQDFLAPEADEKISALLPSSKGADDDDGPAVDLILSDIAANQSGNSVRDAAMSLEVCEAVMRFAERHLKREDEDRDMKGGSLVMKYFVNLNTDEFFRDILKPSFCSAVRSKPASSRSESSEFYFVCKGFKGTFQE
ncbi:23S ribosomal RNA methyltransferase [Schizopora paradoxa]|uniref:rRNA methyltransferase 2, mitochondrial n=1 Tax=Schizopora paradoxa TaxID=27342 RepID=A0A0H2RAB4_9AGAM|nr:23S ribosomal RNA methyltransferase [Schizopora paradoxa]